MSLTPTATTPAPVPAAELLWRPAPTVPAAEVTFELEWATRRAAAFIRKLPPIQPWDEDAFHGEAVAAVAKALHTWDPARGSFGHLCRRLVGFALLEEHRRQTPLSRHDWRQVKAGQMEMPKPALSLEALRGDAEGSMLLERLADPREDVERRVMMRVELDFAAGPPQRPVVPGYGWTPQLIRRIYDMRDSVPWSQIARQIGKGRTSVAALFGRIDRDGLEHVLQNVYRAPTPEQLRYALAQIGRPGYSFGVLAREMDCSEGTLRQMVYQRKKRPVRSAAEGTLTCNEVARLMGFPGDHVRIRGWMARGYLKAERRGQNESWCVPYMVYPADLMDFVSDVRFNHLYDRNRMPPSRFRDAALPYRDPTKGYLTTKQVAARCGKTRNAVKRWIYHGWIRATRMDGFGIWAKEWFILPEWLDEFREKHGHRLKPSERKAA